MTALIQTKKIAVLLSAVMTVQTAVCSSHILQPFSVKASASELSVTDFAEKLQIFSMFSDSAYAYDTLTYHREAGVLYADGQAVGSEWGDLAVSENGLQIRDRAKGSTKGMLPEEADLLPFEENAAEWGYTVTEENGLFTIRNEFQTARLIVKASGEIDDLGAEAVVSGYRDLTVLQYADSAEAYAAYQVYAADSNVEYVQPSRYVSVAGEPAELQADAVLSGLESGSYYTWGANYLRTDLFYDTYLADRELTEEVIVAVLDTGINPRHSMVAGRVVEGGVNFSGSGDDSVEDDYGHGTHCAGTICELTPEQVKILPIKIFDANGKATEEQIYAGLMYAIEQDADLLNMSFGGLGVSPLEAEAMALADAKGIICCAAAGNNGDEARYYYPGGIESCITVAAVDRDLLLADFSNHGDPVDVCAPGVGITSGVLGDNNKTEAWNGTSMATPHATACCAMLLLAWPDLTPEACCAMLTANAVDLGDEGFDEDYAWGLVSLADFAYTDGRCALPEFSEKAGNYGKGFSFEIVCDTEGAEIYYTLDSSVPSPENGIRYTGPISISATTRVRAVAVKEGCMDSLTTECVYSLGGLDVPDPYDVENGVLKAYRGVVRRLVVPNEIDGQVITAIGEAAFAANPYLQEIVLPDSVVSLGDSAFADCSVLTSVEGNAVTTLGAAAFTGCRALEELSFSSQLTEAGESAFADCTALRMLQLDRLTAVPSNCFAGCSALESVYLPAAKTFGAAAFENCGSLASVHCGWESVTVLEDRAFAGCTVFAGSLGFAALEQLGESVFDGAEALLRVSLPEQITSLPRRTFVGCRSLRQLVLPGITEIGDAALAVQQHTFGVSVELPFDRVTHIGTDAFYGCSLGSRGETTTFSAMTEIPYRSFAAVVADSLAFPQVTAVYGQAFADAAIGVIDLPAAQQLGDHSVSNTDWVILSHACISLHEAAIGAETQIYCTSPSQALLEYAEASGHTVTDVPVYVYAFGTNSTVSQYTPLTLTLLTVGEGLRFQWYTVDENGNEIILPDAESHRYRPVVSQMGTAVYVCKAEAGTGLVAEAKFTVTVTAVEQEIMETDRPVYHTDAGPHSLLFVPEADGVYDFTACGDVMSQGTVTDLNGELLGMMTQQPDGTELCTVTLQKGQQYLIHTAPMWQGVYALCASMHPAQAQSVTDAAVLYDASFYPANAEEMPAVTVTAPDGTLLEADRDYHMIFTRSNSRGRIYVFGVGSYSGCLVLPCSVYTSVYADTVNEVSLSGKEDTVTYVFVPRSSGEYYFYSAYLPGYAEEYAYYLRTGALPANRRYYSINPAARIVDEDGSQLAYNDNSGGNGMFRGKVKLQAGRRYLITCTAQAAASFSLVLSKQLYTIADGVVSGLCPYNYREDIPAKPNAGLSVEGIPLEKGRDFLQIDSFNDVPGLGTVIMQGIGLYTGTAQWSYQINYFGSDAVSVEMGGTTGLSFDAASRIRAVRFTARSRNAESNTDMYRIFNDDGKNKRLRHSLYAYSERTGMYSLVATGTGICDYELKNGEYCVVFYLVYGGKPANHTVTVLQPHSLADADVIVAPQIYTGGIVTPEYLVTANGVPMTEGVDFKVRYFTDPVMFGTQEYLLEPLNTAYGRISGTFEIVVKLPEDAPLLTEGQHTVQVTLEERLAVYRFVSETDATYMLSNAQPMDVVMRAFSADGTVLCEGYGTGEQYVTFDAKAGETCYIMIKFNGTLRAGTIHFGLTNDYHLLSDCEVVAQQLPWTGEPLVPVVQFYDGEKLLTEGVDYELRYCNDHINVGTGTAHYRGIGEYFGTCEVQFSVVAPDLFALPDVEVFPVLLDAIRKGDEETDCDYHIYSYTAGRDCEIRLDVFDVYCLLTAQLYREDGMLADSFTTKLNDSMTFSMTAGETVYVLMSATDISSWNQTYSLMFSLAEPVGDSMIEDTEHNVTYLVNQENGYAEGYRFAEDADSVVLLPEINGVPVAYYPEALFSELPKGFVVYGYAGCAAEQYADQYGFVYLSAESEEPTTVDGDLNGDGSCSVADVVLHSHMVAETEALSVPAACMRAADFDGDGLLTLLDTLALLQKLISL